MKTNSSDLNLPVPFISYLCRSTINGICKCRQESETQVPQTKLITLSNCNKDDHDNL